MDSKEKRNVLILSPFFRPNIGGAETHLEDLTKLLTKKNYKVYVLTYTPLTTPVENVPLVEVSDGVEVYRIPWIGHNLFLKLESYFPLAFLYLFGPLFAYSFFFMLRHRVDVVHAHGVIAASIASVLSPLFRFRSVMSIHGNYEFTGRPLLSVLTKLILNRIDALLALSESSRRDFMNAGIPPEKLGIYTHWVDQNLFKPRQDLRRLRSELALEQGDFIVLFVGRLIEKKGMRVLIDVARQSPIKTKFLFVGTGPMEKLIEEAALKQKNIRFIGKVPVEKLVEYYGAADIFVVPSQANEGFPRVVLEALSCGTPVLAADRGCLPETIDGSVGFVVEPDSKNLLAKITYLATRPEELESLKRNCRSYAERKYSDKNINQIITAYEGRTS